MMWHCTRTQTKVLLVATLLVFSGYGLILAQNWQDARRGVANDLTAQGVGAFAAVPENEYNTLALQLDTRAQELDAREASLASAERGSTTDTGTLLVVSVVGGALLGLILLNFYLDSKRRMALM